VRLDDLTPREYEVLANLVRRRIAGVERDRTRPGQAERRAELAAEGRGDAGLGQLERLRHLHAKLVALARTAWAEVGR
jgi:hypothetical protein